MIDFDIKLHGNAISHFHIHGHGTINLPSKKLIFDPSVLYYLMTCDVKENKFEIYLPDNLLKLIHLSKKDNNYRKFLQNFLTFFSYSRKNDLKENNWSRFFKNIEKIKIKIITTEKIEDKQKYDTIVSMFQKHKFYISMSPKLNFLGDILAKIITFSKQTGFAILSKTRRFSNLLREKIVSLELPKMLDDAVSIKGEIVGRLFDFQGGKATKFFIGITLTVGGFVHVHPAIAVPGLIFAFTDP